MSDADRARKLRRRHMHERQAVIFGVLLAFLALAFVTAAAVYTGRLDLPWDREFTSEPTPTASHNPEPCPPVGALPVAANEITVNVYNGAGISGLARTTGAALTERGFVVATTANATPYTGTARINFGYTGVAQAYTLAAQIDDVELQLDGRQDASVDVTLGEAFLAIKAPENVGLDPAVPLTGQPGCIPYETLIPPTTPTAAPPAEGEQPPAEAPQG